MKIEMFIVLEAEFWKRSRPWGRSALGGVPAGAGAELGDTPEASGAWRVVLPRDAVRGRGGTCPGNEGEHNWDLVSMQVLF